MRQHQSGITMKDYCSASINTSNTIQLSGDYGISFLPE
jgi:hypothetical protein